eukprot:318395-Pelagomonas_calceolata.AAC.3
MLDGAMIVASSVICIFFLLWPQVWVKSEQQVLAAFGPAIMFLILKFSSRRICFACLSQILASPDSRSCPPCPFTGAGCCKGQMLKELLQKGCPADELDEFSVTPILKASQGGYADCVLTLLDAKVRPSCMHVDSP